MPIPWLAVAIGASTAFSFMGSIRTMKNMKRASEWDKYNKKIETSYKTIQANERARILLSAKRAAQGARGVVIGTGSTLMEQNAVVDNLEDTIFWINKGAEMSVRDIDIRLAGALQQEAWNAGTSLITGMGTTYQHRDT